MEKNIVSSRLTTYTAIILPPSPVDHDADENDFDYDIDDELLTDDTKENQTKQHSSSSRGGKKRLNENKKMTAQQTIASSENLSPLYPGSAKKRSKKLAVATEESTPNISPPRLYASQTVKLTCKAPAASVEYIMKIISEICGETFTRAALISTIENKCDADRDVILDNLDFVLDYLSEDNKIFLYDGEYIRM